MENISTMYGEFEYDKDSIITFNKGIPGFEEYKKYLLLKLDIEGFELLQSVEENKIGFIVVSPFDIDESYEVKLTEDFISKLKIKEATDVKLLGIVTLNSSIEKTTVNLKAPIIINVKNNFAEQLLTDNSKYKIKHPLTKR